LDLVLEGPCLLLHHPPLRLELSLQDSHLLPLLLPPAALALVVLQWITIIPLVEVDLDLVLLHLHLEVPLVLLLHSAPQQQQRLEALAPPLLPLSLAVEALAVLSLPLEVLLVGLVLLRHLHLVHLHSNRKVVLLLERLNNNPLPLVHLNLPRVK
jgi:hypothetical protein